MSLSLVFFFSSRRRHTRCGRDWSSDVCSSDLKTLVIPAIFPFWVTGAVTAAGGAWNASIVAEVATWGKDKLVADGRSEERRVGKEGRSRWARDQWKKKVK